MAIGGPIIASLILIISLMLTYLAWKYNQEILMVQSTLRFNTVTQEIIITLQNNINKEKGLVDNSSLDYNWHDFLVGIFSNRQYTYQGVYFKIYDGDTPTSANLIYDSYPEQKSDSMRITGQSSLEKVDHVSVFGSSVWSVSFIASKKDLLGTTTAQLPLLIVVVGVVASFSLFGIVLSLVTARRRAVDIADITTKDLKEKTKQLEASTVLLSKETHKTNAILSSMGECLIGVSNEGKVLFMNQIATVMVGYAEADAHGRDINEILPLFKNEKMLEQSESPIYKAIQNKDMGRIYFHDDIFTRDRTGRMYPLVLSATPLLKNMSAEGIAVIIMFHDISLEKAVDRAKTEFISLAAHQLRMPLTTIRWYTEMLIDGDRGDIPKDQKDYIDEIYESTKRMITLVNNLLNVSRVRMGTFAIEPTPNDIFKIVDSVIAELKPTITKKKMNITTDYNEKMKIFNADANLMRVIFQNLISNALKYTPEEGVIKISIGENNNQFFISVADNGYGIPKDDQSKIFSQLYRADNVMKKETEGSGLGLFMVKTIVEQAGGTISFTSEENKGTTFFVTFPKTGMRAKKGNVKIT